MSVKHKLNIFEKKTYDILVILDFCENFPRFWQIFCYPDPFHDRRIAEMNTHFTINVLSDF